MSQPYIGEIRIFASTFAPVGWAFCDGSVMPISEYETLFNLIGTTYGGDGEETFNLPDLRSRIPVHAGTGAGTSAGVTRQVGEAAGAEEVVLSIQQLPSHSHTPIGAATPTTNAPAGAVWAAWADAPYSNDSPIDSMRGQLLDVNGGALPHDNVAPYLAVNFIISLFGVFPSPT
jgi:microcystin-dependent protein